MEQKPQKKRARSAEPQLLQPVIDKQLKSKDKKLNAQLRGIKSQKNLAQRSKKLTSFLQKEHGGYLEADKGEKTLQFRQEQLKPLLQLQNAQKIFDLDLDQGRYSIDFSRNGRSLLLASSKGHLALMEWRNKRLKCEINVKESVRDAVFLQNEAMFAVAQKRYVFIYDNNGVELHKLQSHLEPAHLEYLPYHFLLVSASRLGFLKYHDVSTGQIVAEYRCNLREPCAMRQNANNGIICIGDNRGQVCQYSPNTPKPLVQLLAHKANVTALAVAGNGHHLVTAGAEGAWKVWDLRMHKTLYQYWSPTLVTHCAISQRGLLALSLAGGGSLQVWRDWQREKQSVPYMKHEASANRAISDLAFAPFEDFLGIGLDGGYQSIVVPGSGEANFDSFEANPFSTKKQASEDLVHKLIEKLPFSTIQLDAQAIGRIDTASHEVLEREAEVEEQLQQAKSEKNKKKKRKMRGKQRSGNQEAALEAAAAEKQRLKLKEHVDIKIRQKQAEKQRKKEEIGVLTHLDELTEFDPVEVLRRSATSTKQSKKVKLN